MHKGHLASVCNKLHESGYNVYNIIPEPCIFTIEKNNKEMLVICRDSMRKVFKGLLSEQNVINNITETFEDCYSNNTLEQKGTFTRKGISLKKFMKDYTII